MPCIPPTIPQSTSFWMLHAWLLLPRPISSVQPDNLTMPLTTTTNARKDSMTGGQVLSQFKNALERRRSLVSDPSDRSANVLPALPAQPTPTKPSLKMPNFSSDGASFQISGNASPAQGRSGSPASVTSMSASQQNLAFSLAGLPWVDRPQHVAGLRTGQSTPLRSKTSDASLSSQIRASNSGSPATMAPTAGKTRRRPNSISAASRSSSQGPVNTVRSRPSIGSIAELEASIARLPSNLGTPLALTPGGSRSGTPRQDMSRRGSGDQGAEVTQRGRGSVSDLRASSTSRPSSKSRGNPEESDMTSSAYWGMIQRAADGGR